MILQDEYLPATEMKKKREKGHSVLGTELINATPGCVTVPPLSLKLQENVVAGIAQKYTV